jgi:hypothetical protein
MRLDKYASSVLASSVLASPMIAASRKAQLAGVGQWKAPGNLSSKVSSEALDELLH